MDISSLMQMAEKLQKEIGSNQEAATKLRVTGEAGGGLVRVVLNGRYEAIEVKLDPKAVNPQELQLLEDLVRAAYNQASARVMAEIQSRVGSFASNLGIDPSVLNSFIPKP
jgi:DNA-binding YbaB/EbfC family protein